MLLHLLEHSRATSSTLNGQVLCNRRSMAPAPDTSYNLCCAACCGLELPGSGLKAGACLDMPSALRRYASVLRRCAMDGSDLRPPFDCPTGTFLSPAALEAALLHRLPGFLEDPRVGTRT